ncbi:hypothetical protein [Bradyrhizobium sp. RT4b]|uniref:hypothetical protein n=1 Tax=Bradyrhizobium sp. RT4b TaxID=3156379 RepID=UPI003396D86C
MAPKHHPTPLSGGDRIVTALDRASSVWGKWEADREEVAKAAAPCWIPVEDLRVSLNNLPGPPLTNTDVEQRLRAIWEEPYTTYPNEELKDGCLALYQSERAQGTEMRAIIGMLQEHLEREDERLRREQEERYRKLKEDERVLEQRFLSGADCGWTPIDSSPALYCRRNGRAFRIAQGKDKRWTLYRIKTIDDKGELLGLYQGRGDANKALKTIAYANEQ